MAPVGHTDTRWNVWGRIVASVSVIGGVLTVIAVLLLGVVLYQFASEFGGSPPPWWYWPLVVGFAAAGALGLVLTSSAPWLAYLLRLVGWIPVLTVGMSGPWLMAAAVAVGAAHLRLLLSTASWARHLPVRLLAGVAVSVGLAFLVVPIEKDLSCENIGDPPGTCEAWYTSVVGWGVFEEDDQQLVGWVVVVTLAGVLVVIPDSPRT